MEDVKFDYNASDKEKIEFIDKYKDEMVSGQIAYCITTLKDFKLLEEYIEKYAVNFEDGVFISVIYHLKNDDFKTKLIDRYSNLLDRHLCVSISCITNYELMEEYIEKYKEKIGTIGLTVMVRLFKNDEYKIRVIDKFLNLFDNVLLGQCISQITNHKLMEKYIEKYNEKLGPIGLLSIIINLEHDEDRLKIIDKYCDMFDSNWLGISISVIDNLDLICAYIKKCNKKLGIEGLFKTIEKTKIKNDNKKLEQLKVKLNDLFKDDSLRLKQLSNIERLYNCNSKEMQHIITNILVYLESIPIEEHDETISRLENLFLNDNLPMFAKLYKVFNIMHPDLLNFEHYNFQSPNLNKKINTTYKELIITTDLLKTSMGSNNRSLKRYITNIIYGNEIAKKVLSNNDISILSEQEYEVLKKYILYLNELYDISFKGKDNYQYVSDDLIFELNKYIKLFSNNDNFSIDDLPNRIVRMFGHFIEIDTIDDLVNTMNNMIKSADERNRTRAQNNKFEIHKGDFVKGLANQDEPDEFYSFLTTIFQNGSLCKEFLGSAARSDTTPLDTDLSRLLDEPKEFNEVFTDQKYASTRYGPLWIVLKFDDRFNETTIENNEYIKNKLELFETDMDLAGHYGIRTGFASSDIDYLVVDENNIKLDRIKYEIVMNGFYIPVLNTYGKLVFSPNEYDMLRSNIQGLSYYETENNYMFSEYLDNYECKNDVFNYLENNKNIYKYDCNKYSTKDCINDRLCCIKNIDSEAYLKVIDNIICAKELLKGMDESFIENWILQNGGSLECAINNFINNSKDKSYEEFSKNNCLWDFGESHHLKDNYSHKDYIKEYLNEELYNNMKERINNYNNIKSDEYGMATSF